MDTDRLTGKRMIERRHRERERMIERRHRDRQTDRGELQRHRYRQNIRSNQGIYYRDTW